jgi:hypothetical protein
VVLALSACAPEDEDAAGSATTAADSCAKDKLQLTTAGKLTIGTDKPAYDPWFSNDGAVRERAKPERLFGDPREPRTRQFLRRVTESGRAGR